MEFRRQKDCLEISELDPFLAELLRQIPESCNVEGVEAAQRRIADVGLADRVTIKVADGSLGDPDGAPWDGIIVTAAAPAIPIELRDQLAEGGRLVIPVGSRDLQTLMLVVRHGNDWHETPHGACVFVPLVGPGGFPA